MVAENTYAFTITSTDRCNCACTYCHYYSDGSKATKRNGGTRRGLFRKDIDDKTLEAYFRFISFFKRKFQKSNIFYRFSGGDPMVLGDRLFEMAKRGLEVTGIKPYILTAGKALSKQWIEKAKQSSLSHACISLENPLNPDPGAPDPRRILEKLRDLNSDDFPLRLGMTIVRNSDFNKLYNVCEYIYNEIGILPNLSEINYDKLTVPTEQEIEGFQENVYKIYQRWLGETRINIFPYIAPELYSDHGSVRSYLVELDIHDPYEIKKADDYDQIIDQVIEVQEKRSYPKSGCIENTCPWFKNCERVKQHWMVEYHNSSVSKKDRFQVYCKLKKSIMVAYYMAALEKKESRLC